MRLEVLIRVGVHVVVERVGGRGDVEAVVLVHAAVGCWRVDVSGFGGSARHSGCWLKVCGCGEERWSGREVMMSLKLQGEPSRSALLGGSLNVLRLELDAREGGSGWDSWRSGSLDISWTRASMDRPEG